MNCPHWLLALAIPFSRSDRARTALGRVGAGCSEGLLRTGRSDRSNRWRVSFGCRRALGGRSDGRLTLTDCAPERQRTRAQGIVPEPCSSRRASHGTGAARSPRGSPPGGPHRSPPGLGAAGPTPDRPTRTNLVVVTCGVPRRALPHATRCRELNELSASKWSPTPRCVLRMLISSIYRQPVRLG
jgi:hypothetical protein